MVNQIALGVRLHDQLVLQLRDMLPVLLDENCIFLVFIKPRFRQLRRMMAHMDEDQQDKILTDEIKILVSL